MSRIEQTNNNSSQELVPYESNFVLSTPQGKKAWTFAYGDSVTEALQPSMEAPLSLEEVMGIVHSPRILEKQTPRGVNNLFYS